MRGPRWSGAPGWGREARTHRVPLRVLSGAPLQCSQVLPARRTPAPRLTPRAQWARAAPLCPVSHPQSWIESTAGTGGTPHRRCAGCDQGRDREGAATSQGGSGPAHLSGGRSRGWDGQAPRRPPPASWPARGGGGFPWPFGVSGSVGLRKELVLVTWRGATPSRGAGHLLSCLLLPVCKDPGRFPGTPTSLPEGSPRRVRKTTEAKTSG